MADALSQAKAALEHAKSFQGNVAKQSGHEFSHAPYSLAKKQASTQPQPKKNSEISDIMTGLKWKQDQVNAVKQ